MNAPPSPSGLRRDAVRLSPTWVRFLLAGVLLLSFLAPTPGRAAAAPLSAGDLIIDSKNGADWTAELLTFRGGVQMLEPQMYLECALLRVFLETNSAASPTGGNASPTGGNASPSGGNLSNMNMRVRSIVAETNLLVMAKDATIIGDRGVYTASNDMVVVTGDLVVLETERSFAYCTNVVVNRKTGEGYVVGWSVVEVKAGSGLGLKEGTPPRLGPDRRDRARERGSGLGTPIPATPGTPGPVEVPPGDRKP